MLARISGRTPAEVADSSVLQWGRAIAGADISHASTQQSPRPLASMGPRHCWRGYSHQYVQTEDRKGASMGPRHCWRGYARLRSRLGTWRIRFNGAAPLLARIYRWARGPAASLRASMGPRHCWRGYRELRALFETLTPTASMGPRHCWRGYSARGRKHCARCSSFNGAAPLLARISRCRRVGKTPKEKLQWGRAIAGADITIPCVWVERLRDRLQWGRAIAGADIGPSLAARLAASDASMGPRHCWRGYGILTRCIGQSMDRFNGAAPLLARICPCPKAWRAWIGLGLQWGRAIAGADMTKRYCAPFARAGASMGPRHCWRGYRR